MVVLLVWAAVEEEGMSCTHPPSCLLDAVDLPKALIVLSLPVGQPGAKHPPWFLFYFPAERGTFHLGPLGCCSAVLSQTRTAGALTSS